VISQDFS